MSYEEEDKCAAQADVLKKLSMYDKRDLLSALRRQTP
jgi:hypothetical protein